MLNEIFSLIDISAVSGIDAINDKQVASSAITLVYSKLNQYAINVFYVINDKYSGVITIAFVLYVMHWGYSMMRGLMENPASESVRKFLILTIAYTLAVHDTVFKTYILDLITNGVNHLGGVIVTSISQHNSNINPPSNLNTTYWLLDSLWNYGMDLIKFAQTQCHIWSNPTWCFVVIGLAIGLMMIFIEILAMFVIAMIGIAVLISLFPLFMVLSIFEGVPRQLFDGWLKLLLTHVFIQLLVAVTATFIIVLILPAKATSGGTVETLSFPHSLAYFSMIIMMYFLGKRFIEKIPENAAVIAGSLSSNYQSIRDVAKEEYRRGRARASAAGAGIKAAWGGGKWVSSKSSRKSNVSKS